MGRQAFHTVKPIVILTNHLHCLWTLPPDDADFSTRWRLITSFFSRHCPEQYKRQRSSSHSKKSEQAIWQRRFWEHQIRNRQDFVRHVDYVHYNPVRHQLVKSPRNWPYSSFHRYVAQGFYPEDWAASVEIDLPDKVGEEQKIVALASEC